MIKIIDYIILGEMRKEFIKEKKFYLYLLLILDVRNLKFLVNVEIFIVIIKKLSWLYKDKYLFKKWIMENNNFNKY